MLQKHFFTIKLDFEADPLFVFFCFVLFFLFFCRSISNFFLASFPSLFFSLSFLFIFYVLSPCYPLGKFWQQPFTKPGNGTLINYRWLGLWVVQYLLWTSNFRGILKQYCSLSSGIGALFVPFVLLFLWPIMWDVQWGAGRLWPLDTFFWNSSARIWLMLKMDTLMDGSVLAVLAAYQDNLVTSKMMASQVVQYLPPPPNVDKSRLSQRKC